MKLSITETMQGAFQDFKQNPKVLITASALSMVITSVGAAVVAGVASAGGGTAALIALGVVYVGIAMFLSMGMIGLTLKIVRGQRPRVSDLFGQGSSLVRAIGTVLANLVLGLSVAAPLAFIPAMGPVLSVLAFLFVMSLTCLAPHYVVDKKQWPIGAIISSVRDTTGHRFPMMGVLGLGMLLVTFSALIPVLGPLIAGPIFTLALSRAFVRVRGAETLRPARARATVPPEPPLPQVPDEVVESTLQRFEEELRAEGTLPA